MSDLFTSSQKKAVLFIVVFFSLAVAYHFLDALLHPPNSYDFSPFEEKFYARYDSIQQVLQKKEADPPKMTAAFKESRAGKPKRSTQKKSPEIKTKKAEEPPAAVETAAKPLPPININTATIEELTILPRIGPKIAARIIEYRSLHGNFTAKEDLTKVKGIGPKTFENLKDLITVEESLQP